MEGPKNRSTAFVRCLTKVFPPWYLLVGVLYLYIATFAFILPWICQDLGFSLYYNPSKQTKERIDQKNDKRTWKAYESLRKLREPAGPIADLKIKDGGVKIAFVVISVHRRAKPRYLVQVVSRLLEQTSADNSFGWNTKTIVFNADTNPSDNEDATFISDYVTVVTRQLLDGKTNVSFGDVYEKEKLDYVLALQIGIQLNAEYTVVIEDDALPDRYFFRNLGFLITWKIPWLRSSPRWAFLKLYYPEKWQGFGNTEIPELVVIFIVGGIIPSTLFMWTRKNKHKLIGTVVFIFLTCGGYFTSVAFTIGRAHLIELEKVSPIFYRVSQAPGCCTPAVLFPKKHIKELVSFLMRSKCSTNYPLDFALDGFVSSQKLVKYLASPNLVSHIGFHSSLNKADKDLREFLLLFDP